MTFERKEPILSRFSPGGVVRIVETEDGREAEGDLEWCRYGSEAGEDGKKS
jgi:hypothetical protein